MTSRRDALLLVADTIKGLCLRFDAAFSEKS
jgi:hypothetical protein